jgi:hypothetical protein
MRAKQVYYRESSEEEERELEQLTDSAGENDRGDSEAEEEFVIPGYIEEDEIEKILTWRTEKGATNSDQCNSFL